MALLFVHVCRTARVRVVLYTRGCYLCTFVTFRYPTFYARRYVPIVGRAFRFRYVDVVRVPRLPPPPLLFPRCDVELVPLFAVGCRRLQHATFVLYLGRGLFTDPSCFFPHTVVLRYTL